jgi:hypothetical protein
LRGSRRQRMLCERLAQDRAQVQDRHSLDGCDSSRTVAPSNANIVKRHRVIRHASSCWLVLCLVGATNLCRHGRLSLAPEPFF